MAAGCPVNNGLMTDFTETALLFMPRPPPGATMQILTLKAKSSFFLVTDCYFVFLGNF
jgi:hypothetical protein